ncbi:MAG: hypothetical protein JEZ03_16940 [Bacteroidales bacterium]|nr:hypothetical protein [Bacteroidales bacterium]
MDRLSFNSKYKSAHKERYRKTLQFMQAVVSKDDKILDLGPVNAFSDILINDLYSVQNTPINLDLDFNYKELQSEYYDIVSAFEIFEHLVSPFPLLLSIKAPKLIASVPLKLWFADAYWNEKDPFDRHYHEFEPRQFDMLLQKAGWKICKSEKWVAKVNKIGIRPLLRRFTPRYYIVYCERM